MKQENKELLLQDLCARLPYNPMVEYKGETYNVLGISHGRLILCKPFMSHTLDEYPPLVQEAKPYLFPLSSMTIKQKVELANLTCETSSLFETAIIEIEFYNKHHIDYRDLIPKGLAKDATGLNIY